MNRIRSRFTTLMATTVALLALGTTALAEDDASDSVTKRSAASVLGGLRLLSEDQDFELDRACLRNTSADGTWTDTNHSLSFILSHDLKTPPRRDDMKVHAPAGLKVATVEVQPRVVIVTLVPDGEEGHLFRANDVTCIDVAGFDYVDHLPHGWSVAGSYPGSESAGD